MVCSVAIKHLGVRDVHVAAMVWGLGWPYHALSMGADLRKWNRLFSNFSWHTPMQQCVVASENMENGVDVVVMSDTHNRHHRVLVPLGGDVVVHCGDFTNYCTYAEVASFAEWFGALPHKFKLVIPGNHDIVLDTKYYDATWDMWHHQKESAARIRRLFEAQGITLLVNEFVEVEGVVFAGYSCVPSRGPFGAFQKDESKQFLDSCAHQRVDVLLTHSPPYGVLDRNTLGAHVGCPDVSAIVTALNPQFHVFGHVHSGYGCSAGEGGTTSINASMVSDFYCTNRSPPTFSCMRKYPTESVR